MEITQILPKNSNLINRYSDDKIVVNQIDWTQNLIVTNNEVQIYQDAKLILEEEVFTKLVDKIKQSNPNEKNIYLIIGTGKKIFILPEKLKYIAQNLGVNVETMTTFAACRTFNNLVCENRFVIAVLIINRNSILN